MPNSGSRAEGGRWTICKLGGSEPDSVRDQTIEGPYTYGPIEVVRASSLLAAQEDAKEQRRQARVQQEKKIAAEKKLRRIAELRGAAARLALLTPYRGGADLADDALVELHDALARAALTDEEPKR
jgi:hypothetical protein